jgi:hypothetical protein
MVVFDQGTTAIWKSANSGATWTTATAPVQMQGFAVASTDGTAFIVQGDVGFGGFNPVYVSTDSGQSWVSVMDLPSQMEQVTCSSDGTKVFASSSTETIYYGASFTTLGTTGSLAGAQYDELELQYFGSGLFSVVSNQGGGSLTVQ